MEHAAEIIPERCLRDCAPLVAVAAPRRQTGPVLAAFAARLVRGGRIYCLDGGGAFDPAGLIIRLREMGLDPREALDRVFISRAYTCHQLLGAAETMLPPLLGQEPRPAALLLGLDAMFLDEDLAAWEREYLFGRILARAAELRGRGLPILITLMSPAPSPWRDRVARLSPVLPPGAARLEYFAEE